MQIIIIIHPFTAEGCSKNEITQEKKHFKCYSTKQNMSLNVRMRVGGTLPLTIKLTSLRVIRRCSRLDLPGTVAKASRHLNSYNITWFPRTHCVISDIHVYCLNSYFKEYRICLKRSLQVDEQRDGDRGKGD